MSRTVNCVSLGKEAEGLDYAPYPGELGQRIYDSVSKEAWQRWLGHQTMLINEYRLTPIEPEARKFLETEMEKFQCVQCGNCCLNLNDAFCTTADPEDLNRWEKEGRWDILDWVSFLLEGDRTLARMSEGRHKPQVHGTHGPAPTRLPEAKPLVTGSRQSFGHPHAR